MSTQTIHKCDRCGAVEYDNHNFLGRLTFSADCKDKWDGYILGPKSVEWCRKCHLEVGTLQPWVGKEKCGDDEPNPKPTVEELIRMMIREEMEA
jgi:hypothetical protein